MVALGGMGCATGRWRGMQWGEHGAVFGGRKADFGSATQFLEERNAILGGMRRGSWGSATRFLGERDAARHVATKTAGSSLMGSTRGGYGMRNRASGNEGSIGRAPGGLREDSPTHPVYHAHIPRPPPLLPPPHAAYQRAVRAVFVAAWRAAPRLEFDALRSEPAATPKSNSTQWPLRKCPAVGAGSSRFSRRFPRPALPSAHTTPATTSPSPACRLSTGGAGVFGSGVACRAAIRASPLSD